VVSQRKKPMQCDAHLASNLPDRRTLLGLMQRKGYLLLGKPAPFHCLKTSFLTICLQ
jgi:hypothetical protein